METGSASGVDPAAVHEHQKSGDAGEGGAEGIAVSQGHNGAVNGELEQGGNGHDGWSVAE